MAGKGKKAPKSGKAKGKSGKKGGRKPNRTFARWIFRVIKQNNKSLGVSAKGMAVLNSFVNYAFGSIASEASALVQGGKGRTLGAKEVSAAVRFALPGELGRHAAVEGAKAVAKFSNA